MILIPIDPISTAGIPKDRIDDNADLSCILKGTRMLKFKIIAAVVAALLTMIVVLQNTEAMSTDVLFASVTMPRALLLFLTFTIGVVVGLLIAFSFATARKKAAMSKENNNLK